MLRVSRPMLVVVLKDWVAPRKGSHVVGVTNCLKHAVGSNGRQNVVMFESVLNNPGDRKRFDR